MPDTILYIFVFAAGASVGSFLNVCIHRIPLRLSLLSPPSRCPKCLTKIRFYDNIPVLSYMMLRGRCRACNVRISVEYPLVEAVTALFFIALYFKFGLGLAFFAFSVFVSSLIAVTFIDLHLKIIPDVISIPGIAVGFVFSIILGYPSFYGALNSAAGIILGGGILLTIGIIYSWITGTEGMGGGDVKLLAMVGAFLGWKGILFTLFAGSFVGAAIGVIMMSLYGKTSKYAIPFGPFLSLGALFYLFFGTELIGWYVALIWPQ